MKNKHWLQIEEEFIKKFGDRYNGIGSNKDIISTGTELNDVLAFFKPYFQEQRHKEAVEELEVVDNTNTDTNS